MIFLELAVLALLYGLKGVADVPTSCFILTYFAVFSTVASLVWQVGKNYGERHNNDE